MIPVFIGYISVGLNMYVLNNEVLSTSDFIAFNDSVTD